jgi:hypothetical protein
MASAYPEATAAYDRLVTAQENAMTMLSDLDASGRASSSVLEALDQRIADMMDAVPPAAETARTPEELATLLATYASITAGYESIAADARAIMHPAPKGMSPISKLYIAGGIALAVGYGVWYAQRGRR